MRAAPAALLLAALPLAGSLHAAEPGVWQILPGMTSSQQALAGAQVAAATSHALPDGNHLLITFWRDGDRTTRCLALLDAQLRRAEERCEQPITPR
ncbi:MAG: hypothetical protein ACFCUS_04090 [Rubrimonas sp.]